MQLRCILAALVGVALMLTGCSIDTLPTDPDLESSDLDQASSMSKRSGDPKWDKDGNGYPDAGISVTKKYTSIYAYDFAYGDYGDWYWDLGDGRIYGTVASVDDLDQQTLTTCDYVVNYRGDFNNDPYLDSGWIQNHINCRGYDDNNHYNYLIVHETDPRYTGNSAWAIWGTWEYKALTISGFGNLVRPQNYSGD